LTAVTLAKNHRNAGKQPEIIASIYAVLTEEIWQIIAVRTRRSINHRSTWPEMKPFGWV
jgi:hypothetical protein